MDSSCRLKLVDPDQLATDLGLHCFKKNVLNIEEKNMDILGLLD